VALVVSQLPNDFGESRESGVTISSADEVAEHPFTRTLIPRKSAADCEPRAIRNHQTVCAAAGDFTFDNGALTSP